MKLSISSIKRIALSTQTVVWIAMLALIPSSVLGDVTYTPKSSYASLPRITLTGQIRAVDLEKEWQRISRVKVKIDRYKDAWIDGDAFIDTTGSAGGVKDCTKNVGGCTMCPWMQCPTFGDRVNLAGKAGAKTG